LELFSKWSENFDALLLMKHFMVEVGCSKLEEFLLSSFFCKSSESRCCERVLASAGGDVMAPLQQQVVLIS